MVRDDPVEGTGEQGDDEDDGDNDDDDEAEDGSVDDKLIILCNGDDGQ